MSNNNPADRIEEIMWNNRGRKELAAAIIEGAAQQLGQTVQVDWTSLVFGKKGIHEKTPSRALSTRICDLMHPHVPGGEFFHYTKIEGFTGILGSGVLRLGQLLKRIEEDEIRAYADQHGWSGYLGDYAETLARDLFYTSLTRTDAPNSDFMWEEFADGGTGVRLRLRIEVDGARPHHAELRSMHYLDGGKTLLNRINEDLAANGLPDFLPWSASKIGAFGLPSGYDDESEVRLLFKHHQGAPVRRKTDGKFDFIEVPIGEPNDFASVDLIAIEAGPNARLDEVEKIVQASALAGTATSRVSA